MKRVISRITIYASLHKSPRKNKAYRMVFTRKKDGATTYTDFGSHMENYTEHHDDLRKQRFLSRFRSLISKYKDNPQAPITLSTMILWNQPTIEASLRDYKNHFGLG